MKTIRFAASGFFAFVFLSFTLFKNNDNNPIKTETGLISGLKSADGKVISYKGIPFAQPPVGELRWRVPQPAKPWTGVRKCESFGPDPYQPAPRAVSMWSEEYFIPKGSVRSEDCLYLNVWRPVKASSKKLPVLVWIYGGGFNSGGTDLKLYDGEATAKRGVIFVGANYRVGIFGGFAHHELSEESGYNASGNYGLLDQIAALKWVQENITAFGGDPKNVTINGQSAGSMSVNCLIASPLAKGLFEKAIAESGAYMVSGARGMNNLQTAEAQGARAMKALNVNSIAGLRKLSSEDVQTKLRAAGGPIIDGYLLPQSIPAIFAEGKQNKVALLTGWNENEGMLQGPLKNASDFKKQMTDAFGAKADEFFSYYPAGNEEEAKTSQYKLSKDGMFGIQNYTLANVESNNGQKVYVYRFTHKVPGTGIYENIGAFHSGEIAYTFSNLKYINRPWQQLDHQLANTISSYWVNFAISGDPNGKGLPAWPAYNPQTIQVMMLSDQPEAETIPDKAALDLIISQYK
ncbi:carboxylesterase/lipase family protein [Mucilaginibacter arboris]|uniref:Carboxylic ester hydrolase n=1 Tax=Mucilaginibacter arboris TaxID=2682090 RepID=A0A7K1T1K0_9SPHI|nr:carboxylesterase family protein [Mucilaginibacter arboris]MVN23456.1 carboxylesterase family protein [Mucilaginibacter arboris]